MRKNFLSVKYKEYENLNGNKEKLIQQVGDGSIIKRFDKTATPNNLKDVVCPHFLELKWAYGCPFNCSWCYLQGTLRFLSTKTKPKIKNYKKITRHIDTFFNETINNGYKAEILNSGEIADSLMWETNGLPFSKFIASLFETQKKHSVLLLSKSHNIDNLLKIDTDNIIPSFTLNSFSVASQWEIGAPNVKKRIEAASELCNVGFPVRIRIDPLVPIKGWLEEYKRLIDHMFSKFNPERITLGSLRGLQSTINNAEDKSWVNYLSERSNWGRKINFDLRHSIYLSILNYLKKEYNYYNNSLCKETIEMWKFLSMDYKKIKCNCIA